MDTNKSLRPIIGLAFALLLLSACGRVSIPRPGFLASRLAPTATLDPAAPVEPEAGATRLSEEDDAAMVFVASGWFVMGSTEDDAQADDDEHPQHDVMLDGFWIDRTEVTNGQYKQCEAAGACTAPYPTSSYSRAAYYRHPRYANFPVVNVTWQDAADYCEWAGKRLPTEAEWEKAARGVDERLYPWGNSPPNDTLANYGGNEGDTEEVGSYPEGASPYGVLEMAGNVWEWVADPYDVKYYQASPSHNPAGPGSGEERVVRGGSWLLGQRRIRAAYRKSHRPDFRDGTTGFRCASSE
jgi:formylglycine-generating enzyme required for sulfatase activity